METNRKIRKRPLSIRVPFGLTTVFIPTAEDVKAVDHVARAEPVPVTEPEPTSEQTNPSPTVRDDEETEGEPGQSPPGAAYDPETGEINWDCPCLGGMAHGPCGMQFREAFSCFVFSEQDPKGIDCVEKFKAMQDCFRQHPDVYAEGPLAVSVAHEYIVLTVRAELDDDDDSRPAEEPPETTALVAENTLPDAPHESAPVKVHTEP